MKRKKLVSGSELSQSLSRSSIYQDFLAEREEVLKHKWIESEKAGHDIGYERALVDWIMNHREKCAPPESAPEPARAVSLSRDAHRP